MEDIDRAADFQGLRDGVLRQVAQGIDRLEPEAMPEGSASRCADYRDGFVEARERARQLALESNAAETGVPSLTIESLIAALPAMAARLGVMMASEALPLFQKTGYNFDQITPSVSLLFQTKDTEGSFTVSLAINKSPD